MKAKSGAGFTLIELLVVIAIIGLLASVVLTSLNSARAKARDARRKADLHQLRTMLELYYNDNDKYPPAGSCGYGTNCYAFSTDGPNWIPALAQYAFKMPQDPKNNAASPWNTGNYSYSYGNVSADGQVFDLTTQLENTSDPDRCAVRQYVFYFDNRAWCGPYSTQIYESSP
jgi:type II secretion system protein G